MIKVQIDEANGDFSLIDEATGEEGPAVPFGDVATLMANDSIYYATLPYLAEAGDEMVFTENCPEEFDVPVFCVQDSFVVEEFDVVTMRDGFNVQSPDGDNSPGVEYGYVAALQPEGEGAVYFATARSRSDVDPVRCVSRVSKEESMTEWLEDDEPEEEGDEEEGPEYEPADEDEGDETEEVEE